MSPHPGTRRPPLLVVDDEPDLRDAMAELLEEVGLRVHVAADGREALEVLERLPEPCLILLDLMMPRMTGEEFLAELCRRGDARRHRVVVVSASHRAFARFEGLGVLGLLPKPFELGELLALVDRFCPGP